MRGYVDKLFVEVSIHCPVRTDAVSMVLKVATVETAWEGRGGVECEFFGLGLFARMRAFPITVGVSSQVSFFPPTFFIWLST